MIVIVRARAKMEGRLGGVCVCARRGTSSSAQYQYRRRGGAELGHSGCCSRGPVPCRPDGMMPVRARVLP